MRRKTIISWLFAIIGMAISMRWIDLGSARMTNQTAMLIALANLLYCGKQFYVSAFRQLRHRTANMDTLVALSTCIAFLFSAFNTFWGDEVWATRGIAWHTYFDASVMIITLRSHG